MLVGCLTFKVTLFPFNNSAEYSATATAFKILKSLVLLEETLLHCSRATIQVLCSYLPRYPASKARRLQDHAKREPMSWFSRCTLRSRLFGQFEGEQSTSRLKLVIFQQAIVSSKSNQSRSWGLKFVIPFCIFRDNVTWFLRTWGSAFRPGFAVSWFCDLGSQLHLHNEDNPEPSPLGCSLTRENVCSALKHYTFKIESSP